MVHFLKTNLTSVHFASFGLALGLLACGAAKTSTKTATAAAAIDCSVTLTCASPTPSPSPSPSAAPAASVSTGTGTYTVSGPNDPFANVAPATDAVATQFFLTNCVACHDSKVGSVRSFWSIDQATFSTTTLATDTMAPTIYTTLYLKAMNIIDNKPVAMPTVAITPAVSQTLSSVVKWMQVNTPAAVSSAELSFGATTPGGLGVGVVINFQCSQPATFRDYIRRVTNDVFDREPTAAELVLAGADPDVPTTGDMRTMVVNRLFSDPDWITEFQAVGLAKFANKLAGANDIEPLSGFLTQAQATDLGQEFYQMLLANYQTMAFKDILLSNNVMVSPNTAALYGCTAPAAGTWAACLQAQPRGSYFTSFSYLSSKPSSFLATNNNYGRAALMQFFVTGDVLQPGFNQSGGSEVVAPLPTCMKTKDYRGTVSGATIAWMGSAAVPLSANLCQSCHIDREMAMGSILFRPFNKRGFLYGTQAAVDATDLDYTAAIDPSIVSQVGTTGTPTVVNQNFLLSLLTTGDGTEAACVPASDNLGKDLPLGSVKDLASFLIGNGQVLAGGLARHLPRAMSNLDSTSEEIIVRVNQAYQSGGGKLGPLFQAYFSSETYSCAQ